MENGRRIQRDKMNILLCSKNEIAKIDFGDPRIGFPIVQKHIGIAWKGKNGVVRHGMQNRIQDFSIDQSRVFDFVQVKKMKQRRLIGQASQQLRMVGFSVSDKKIRNFGTTERFQRFQIRAAIVGLSVGHENMRDFLFRMFLQLVFDKLLGFLQCFFHVGRSTCHHVLHHVFQYFTRVFQRTLYHFPSYILIERKQTNTNFVIFPMFKMKNAIQNMDKFRQFCAREFLVRNAIVHRSRYIRGDNEMQFFRRDLFHETFIQFQIHM